VTKPDHPADPEGFRDVFDIVVLKSSELCVSARLGTEILSRGKCRMAYDFADSAGEVIVAKYIHKEAILGITRISELLEFLPSWCRSNLRRLHGQATKHPGLKQKTFRSKSGLFKAFLRELKPPDDDDNCAQAVSHAGSVTAETWFFFRALYGRII